MIFRYFLLLLIFCTVWCCSLGFSKPTRTIAIFTPQNTGSSPIQDLAITPFIHQAVQNAVRPYRAANANELPPINDNNADLFSQIITYGSPASGTGAAPQYNGNISSTTWQVAGRDKQAYGFTYDGLDRLTQANYFDIVDQYTSPYTSVYSTDNKFKEAVQYDVRGNIISLQRYGLNGGTWTNNGYTAGTYGQIDNLSYSYDQPSSGNINKSNTLLRVTDVSLANKGFKFRNTRPAASAYDYTYDANGNVTSDRHKGILSIKYNYLNLPEKITFDDEFNNTLEFVYDATGVKLKKIATYMEDGDTHTTDYINGVEYFNDMLQRIAHTEGAVARDGNWYSGGFIHEYVLRDHLGNTRVTFTDANNDGIVSTSDIKQINHYYPFGLNMEGNWQGGSWGQNKYQYNGKELNQDFGLDWNDYGARFYDAALARWTAVDPLADKFFRWSPYNYVENNPISKIDVKGQWSISIHYSLTMFALNASGIFGDQARLLSDYTSVYADHPDGIAIALNNNFTDMGQSCPQHYKSGIDYSRTANSQMLPFPNSSGYNYNIWHSMRSEAEAKTGSITRKGAMMRGMEFGWNMIFKSAKQGRLRDFKANSVGIQDFGQGMHALQDAYAHKGVEPPVRYDHLSNDINHNSTAHLEAEMISSSAVVVHSLISGDFKGLTTDSVKNIQTTGMSKDQFSELMTAIKMFLKN